MLETYRLLIVNPGSTSTKIAIYDNEKPVFEETLRHSNEELSPYPTIYDQYEFRKNVILDTLNTKGINITKLNSVIGRGGLLNPLEGGTYNVNDKMLKDLKEGVMGQHASNLGGIIAHEIASQLNIPAFIVDPVVVDELDDVARITGLPEINRISLFHALNQKAVAKRAAKDLGKKYDQVNLIIAHLGGGISVGAHKKGRVVAVNNALDGEGPMSPERAGSLPIGNLIKLCFSNLYTQEEIKKKVVGKGGLVAHLNTNDGREISERIKAGDKKAELVYYAMAYQVAKEIGGCAAVLEGDVDAVCLTGGLAYDQMFTDWIKKKVKFISEVMIYPGEDEMVAMAQGALGVLREEEKAKVY